ncbi:phospho-sugar mutase [Flavobacterium salmonis]|nr:phospho-sugar mutase [Flavobacterium salmonis]
MDATMNILKEAEEWLNPPFDKETQDKVYEMIASFPDQLKESFYKNLEFGTGGMRGVMGIGSNRINKYTLGKSTQGLSDYLWEVFPDQKIKAVIAYDCRHNSDTLAKIVADVFSANGIEVYLFSGLRPTPELSFALKYLNCQCGIVLTASHNPPEYNGYKVYWEDGGQIVPPQDREIISVIENLKYSQIKFQANEDLIRYIDSDIDEAFIKSTIENASFSTPFAAKDDLNIVFTPLHGTSITVLPDTLAAAGYKNIHIVEEQRMPNGNFPTVKSPNPEEPEALSMALALAEKTNADIAIGTDPDSDRLGVAVRDEEGKMILLNGNQTMIIMTVFLLEQWEKAGKLNGKQFIASTIVSTPMITQVAARYSVGYKSGLTGFKWIAKMIKDFPDLEFIGGGEESFGYMVGDTVRDKDAVSASLLICEAAAQAKACGSSLHKELLKHYAEFGFYKEHLVSITKKGQEGLAEINNMMADLRDKPLKKISNKRVIRIEDFKSSTAINLLTQEKEIIDMPKADVLIYYTEDGSKICARPSGTEPKIKFYISVKEELQNIENFKVVENVLSKKIENILISMQLN